LIELNEYGDTDEVPFGELQLMRTTERRFLDDAWLIILDEDAVEALGMKEKYEYIFDYDGVLKLLQSPADLNEVLPKMPKTMRETVGSVAKRLLDEEKLYDTRVIKAIEENLKISLTD